MNTVKDVDTLQADLQQLRTDLAAIAHTLQTLTGDASSDALAHVRAQAEKARKRAESAAGEISASIEERPLTSLGISFIVGLLLGLLFGRAR